MKQWSLAVAYVVLALSWPGTAQAQCALPRDMTGTWRADDGGTYYVRQVGDEIWWLGQSADGSKSWANVYHGVRNGTTVTGTWADVPRGAKRSSGLLNLLVSDTGSGVSGWRTRRMTGGFSGMSWFMPCSDNQLQPSP